MRDPKSSRVSRRCIAHQRKTAVTRTVDFQARRSIRPVDQAPIGGAPVLGVEGDRCEPITVVRLPLIDPAITGAVLVSARQASAVVVLDPRDLAVVRG